MTGRLSGKEMQNLGKEIQKYDISNYFLEDVSSISCKISSSYGELFDLKYISIEINKSFLFKSFLVYPRALHNYSSGPARKAYLDLPKIVDEDGDTYKAFRISGDIQEIGEGQDKCIGAEVPFKGRVAVCFEFPKIPIKKNKIWFTLNGKSIEMDWQQILSNPIKSD